MAAGAKARAHDRPVSRWLGLAAVARERASEQEVDADRAGDTGAAGLHLEQRAYLLKLAEVYEQRSKDG